MAQTKSISTTQRPCHALSTFLEVRGSPVHGRGVFATKSIRKGTRIIEYTGKRILWTDVPVDLYDPHTLLFGLDGGIHVIDPAKCCTEALWSNHSCQPNCAACEEEDER